MVEISNEKEYEMVWPFGLGVESNPEGKGCMKNEKNDYFVIDIGYNVDNGI